MSQMRLAYLHQAIKTPLFEVKDFVILWILPDAYSSRSYECGRLEKTSWYKIAGYGHHV